MAPQPQIHPSSSSTGLVTSLVDLNHHHAHPSNNSAPHPDDQATDRSSSTSLFSLSCPHSSLSSPINSSPINSSPINSSPINSSPINSSPINSSPINSSPINSSPINSSPITPHKSPTNWAFLPLYQLIARLWALVYSLIQDIIILLFTQPVPADVNNLHPIHHPIARVAIIGAGITGISSAAHFLSNRFEVVIFEQSDSIGGIWARVNSTSSLQLDSLMYRFHPSVKWSNQFPVKKGEILYQLKKIWNRYHLSSRTRFNVTVDHISRQQSSEGRPAQWIINNGTEGLFDAIVVAVGTCGPSERIEFKGRNRFEGTMVHSSELDRVDWNSKRVAVIGGGASAVEALELAVQSGCAAPAVLITRTDKWFIPRNVIIGTIIALNPLGFPSILDQLAEKFVRTFHYRSDLKWMSPIGYNGKAATRLYSKTPIVNGEFLKLVRQGRAEYVRAKINKILPCGIEVQRVSSQEPDMIPADVIVEATGYKRPSLGFLPVEKLFRGSKNSNQYAPPNLFLQSFVPNDWTCLMTNAGYFDGIGTVGHNHIGILARIQMMFLINPKTAPSPIEMRRWVDRIVAFRGSLECFTYAELSIWLATFLISNPLRWSWIIFVATGWGRIGNSKIKTL